MKNIIAVVVSKVFVRCTFELTANDKQLVNDKKTKLPIVNRMAFSE